MIRSSFAYDGLERVLGKPRAGWTASDLVDLYDDGQARLVSLMHVGGDGWLKSLDFVPRSGAHLKAILEMGERADGSSLFRETGIRIDASDILLQPRIQTAFLDPFATLPTLVVRCGHTNPAGDPLPESPDTILRKACDYLASQTGIELMAHGEIEYFLGKVGDAADIYGADDRGYHAASPFVFGEDLRRQALVLLDGMGVPVKYGHSEVGYIEARETHGVIWEQHEIELGLTRLPDAADGVALTHWVLRNLAREYGMRCSTDAIVLEGHAGNGMHFHVAPARDGKLTPIRTPEAGLTDEARWIIGGLVRIGGALMAFGNRSEHSFTRLKQGKEAPRVITWGDFNRAALVRLPVVPPTRDGAQPLSPTIEFRLPDGSALPHLLLAGLAISTVYGHGAADLDEILRTTAATNGVSPDLEHLPGSASEVASALDRYRADLERGHAFPPHMLDGVVARLRASTS